MRDLLSLLTEYRHVKWSATFMKKTELVMRDGLFDVLSDEDGGLQTVRSYMIFQAMISACTLQTSVELLHGIHS
ncbi:hypothetical protein AB4J90_09370 [Geobacillus thermodenitrificans]|uniref:hypothetical protein n=1 Tax=Geobacillus thermodenitrificans TaxID=33940 RepID=UPI0034C64FA6